MNLTIKLPDEDVRALEAKATARGISAEQCRPDFDSGRSGKSATRAEAPPRLLFCRRPTKPSGSLQATRLIPHRYPAACNSNNCA
jgi:hypothetical protein